MPPALVGRAHNGAGLRGGLQVLWDAVTQACRIVNFRHQLHDVICRAQALQASQNDESRTQLLRVLPCRLVTQSTQLLLRIPLTWAVQACGHPVAADAATQRSAQRRAQGAGRLCWLALAGNSLPAEP